MGIVPVSRQGLGILAAGNKKSNTWSISSLVFFWPGFRISGPSLHSGFCTNLSLHGGPDATSYSS